MTDPPLWSCIIDNELNLYSPDNDQSVSAVYIERVNTNHYKLVSKLPGREFEVDVDQLLSEYSQDYEKHRYNPDTALDNLLAPPFQAESGQKLLKVIRQSPQLLSYIMPKGRNEWTHIKRPLALYRLTTLFLRYLETQNLQYTERDTYWLLLRARYLLLASLSTDENAKKEYLPDLDQLIHTARQAWGQLFLTETAVLSLLLQQCGKQIEDEARLLLFPPQSKQPWPFVTTPPAQPFNQTLYQQWFLPRYDRNPILYVSAGQWLASHWWTVLKLIGVTLLIIFLCIPNLSTTISNTVWDIVCAIILSSIGMTFYLPTFFAYTLPRTIPAIFVGYLALISSGEMLDFAIATYEQPNPLFSISIIGIPLILTFLTLYIDVQRRVPSRQTALRRAGNVWLTAVFRSFLIGWFFLLPIGQLLPITSCIYWSSALFGKAYPQLILIFAPLALFIGIFVQTIWDADTLTQPF